MTKKTILLVDDEKLILKVVTDVLNAEGYNVITAREGKEALSILKKTTPDLILLDYFMPGMSGRDICEKIRADEKLKQLNIIFLTVARFSEKGARDLEQMDVRDYIKKPFEYKDLVKRIKKVIGE